MTLLDEMPIFPNGPISRKNDIKLLSDCDVQQAKKDLLDLRIRNL